MKYANQHNMRDPLWDELVFLPAQLSRFPLFSAAEADLSTVIGKSALVPLRLDIPLIISHMSVGELSAELKCSLARAASEAGIANGSGEGGVIADEAEFSSAYIYEYTPELYGLSPELLRRCSAVEIKIGRSSRGGLGEALPDGLPSEVYRLRGIAPDTLFTSAGRFAEINSAADLRITIDGLRDGSGGVPVGVKLAAGHIEDDLAFALEAGADFVTIDGRSSFHSSPLGGCCLPTLCAVARARDWLESNGAELDIVAAGGMRTSADFAKAIALGATAVASASAVLDAVSAVDGEMTLSAAETENRLVKWLRSVGSDLAEICAFTGRSSVGGLSRDDLAALSSDVSGMTGVRRA